MINRVKKKWKIRLIWDLPELSLAMSIQLHKASPLSLGTRANVNQSQERFCVSLPHDLLRMTGVLFPSWYGGPDFQAVVRHTETTALQMGL